MYTWLTHTILQNKKYFLQTKLFEGKANTIYEPTDPIKGFKIASGTN